MSAKVVVAIAAATAALAACGKHNGPTNETNRLGSSVRGDNGVAPNENGTATAASPSPDQTFVNTAAASDAFEIQSSELAATNASSSAVKSFAKHMIEAHTSSTSKLKTAAANASPPVTPTPALTSDQQQKLTQLKSQSGRSFDSVYSDDQVAAHQATLAALRSYSATSGAPALKSFASQMIPIVTAHLNSAKALKR